MLRFVLPLSAALLFSTSLHAAPIGRTLMTALATATPEQTLSVVVVFRGREAPRRELLDRLEALGLNGFHYRVLPMAGVLATPAQVYQLAAMPEVRSLWHNDALMSFDFDGTRFTRVQKLRAEPLLRNAQGLPYTGKGIGVVINDTGVDGTHPDLSFPDHVVQNVMAGTNPAAIAAFPYDPDIANLLPVPIPVDIRGILPIIVLENIPHTDFAGSHGTHVAGIVGGNGASSRGQYTGVAPGANLIGYGSGLGIFVLDGLGGFDWSIAHQAQYNIRVMNNSFGSPSAVGEPFDPEAPFSIATKMAAERGIIPVFAAGNFFSESSIGGGTCMAPWVVCVAAGNAKGELTDFSSRGRFGGTPQTVTIDGETYTWDDRPTITAPGSNVISTRSLTVDPVALTGSLPADPTQPGLAVPPDMLLRYIVLSGTSMAAPHVAGVVALMLEANPRLGWREVKDILQKTAAPMPGYAAWEAGAGYVDAYAAVAMSAGLRADYGAPLPLFHAWNSRADYQLWSERRELVAVSTFGANPRVEFDVGSAPALIQAWGSTDRAVTTVNLIAPDGSVHAANEILPTLATQQQQVTAYAPALPGTWSAELAPFLIPNVGLFPSPPEADAELRVEQFQVEPRAGFTDLGGNALADEIEIAARRHLVDGIAPGRYAPDAPVTRAQLARTLFWSAGLRQSLPLEGGFRFRDVRAEDQPFVAAATARGAAQKDLELNREPLMFADGERFHPDQPVTREEFAYAFVQALGQDPAPAEGAAVAGAQLGDAAYLQAAYALGFLAQPVMAKAAQQGVTRAELAAAANALMLAYRPTSPEMFAPAVRREAAKSAGVSAGGTQGSGLFLGAFAAPLLGVLALARRLLRRPAAPPRDGT